MVSSTKVSLERVTEMSKSDNDLTIMTFEKAFEMTGHGNFNRLVLFTCGLIHLSVSMESVGIGYALPAAECDLNLTSLHKGLISASAFIGIMSTSFIWGYLCDRYGRRGVMLPAMLLSILLSICSAFSTNVWMLFTLRLLTGCLVSSSSATVYAYLGEMHTSSHRASAMAWGAVFISFSFMLLPGLAWLIIPGTWELSIGPLLLKPWRLFILCWSSATLLASIFLCFLPESPKFLISKNCERKVLPILRRMYSMNHGGSLDGFPVQEILEGSDSMPSKYGLKETFKSLSFLFTPPLLRCVIISYTCMFVIFMLSSGLYMWVPEILNSLLNNESTKLLTVCEIINSKSETIYNITADQKIEIEECVPRIADGIFPISIAMGGTFALTYIAIGFLIDKVGKKPLYGFIMCACGAMCAGACVTQGIGLSAALLVGALLSGCVASILAAITVEIFPVDIRAMSMCAMYMCGRAGAAFGSWLLGAMLSTHCPLAFILFGMATMGTSFLMVMWPNPEKVRKQLEQRGLIF